MSLPRRSLLLFGLMLVSVYAAMPERSPRSQGAKVYRQILTGVARIESSDRSRGTGFVVDAKRRWLVTCYHVVGDGDAVDVYFPGSKSSLRGKVVRRSLATDLALIELSSLPAEVRALPLAKTSPAPGERVHLIGNRYDVDTLWTYGIGHIRSFQTQRDGYFNSGKQLAKGARTLLASVPINEGDSGGPLVNDQGEVVGVSAAVAWELQGTGIFIDRSEILSLLGQAPDTHASRPQGLYTQACRGTVVVRYEGGPVRAGVLLDRTRRLVLTTARAVEKEPSVEVTFPVLNDNHVRTDASWYRREGELLQRKGAQSKGVVLAVDTHRNLALVEVARVPDSASPIVFASQRNQPGDSVHIVSHPRNFEAWWVYAAGHVRQQVHKPLGMTNEGAPPAVLIVQAPLGEGEEGGPVLDTEGQLVALASGRVGPQQQIAFAISVEEIRRFLDEHRANVVPNTPMGHVHRAERFVRARDYERAKKEYDAALALDPKHVPAWIGRAWVHYLRGEHDHTIADGDKALSLDPRSPQALTTRAWAKAGKGELAHALHDADAALKHAPRHAMAYAVRAHVHLQRKHFDKAKADADEAIWHDSKLGLAYRLRAYCVEPDKALADLTQAIALDPFDVDSLQARGQLHSTRNEADTALADFDHAIKLAPERASLYLDRASEHLRRGRVNEAKVDLTRLLPRLSDHPRARDHLEKGLKSTESLSSLIERLRPLLSSSR
jgi:S1-C subfamily serine protease